MKYNIWTRDTEWYIEDGYGRCRESKWEIELETEPNQLIELLRKQDYLLINKRWIIPTKEITRIEIC